jgi:hypothetical protein
LEEAIDVIEKNTCSLRVTSKSKNPFKKNYLTKLDHKKHGLTKVLIDEENAAIAKWILVMQNLVCQLLYNN